MGEVRLVGVTVKQDLDNQDRSHDLINVKGLINCN